MTNPTPIPIEEQIRAEVAIALSECYSTFSPLALEKILVIFSKSLQKVREETKREIEIYLRHCIEVLVKDRDLYKTTNSRKTYTLQDIYQVRINQLENLMQSIDKKISANKECKHEKFIGGVCVKCDYVAFSELDEQSICKDVPGVCPGDESYEQKTKREEESKCWAKHLSGGVPPCDHESIGKKKRQTNE